MNLLFVGMNLAAWVIQFVVLTVKNLKPALNAAPMKFVETKTK